MTKPTKWSVIPAKTQISMGIRSDWSESSLSVWRKLGSLATHWCGCPGWSESLLGAQVILLVLSWGGSYNCPRKRMQETVRHHSASLFCAKVTFVMELSTRLVCGQSQVRFSYPATFFHGVWSWNNLYDHLSLPLIQEGELSVTGERMGTTCKYW